MIAGIARMKHKAWIIVATFLLACGVSASASAGWSSCVAVCHTQFVGCIRNHGGKTVCDVEELRCEVHCMTINPTP